MTKDKAALQLEEGLQRIVSELLYYQSTRHMGIKLANLLADYWTIRKAVCVDRSATLACESQIANDSEEIYTRMLQQIKE